MKTTEDKEVLSQNRQILDHLKQGFSITPLEALRRFNCWALAQRISNLRKEGNNIKTTMVKKKNKRFASYKLVI